MLPSSLLHQLFSASASSLCTSSSQEFISSPLSSLSNTYPHHPCRRLCHLRLPPSRPCHSVVACRPGLQTRSLQYRRTEQGDGRGQLLLCACRIWTIECGIWAGWFLSWTKIIHLVVSWSDAWWSHRQFASACCCSVSHVFARIARTRGGNIDRVVQLFGHYFAQGECVGDYFECRYGVSVWFLGVYYLYYHSRRHLPVLIKGKHSVHSTDAVFWVPDVPLDDRPKLSGRHEADVHVYPVADTFRGRCKLTVERGDFDAKTALTIRAVYFSKRCVYYILGLAPNRLQSTELSLVCDRQYDPDGVDKTNPVKSCRTLNRSRTFRGIWSISMAIGFDLVCVIASFSPPKAGPNIAWHCQYPGARWRSTTATLTEIISWWQP